MDEIIRAISKDGNVSCIAISARDMIRRAAGIHKASRTASAALGRTLSAAAMLANMLKKEDASVTVRINGGGAIGTIIAVAEPDGTARCSVANPTADVPLRADGKLDVGRLVGNDGLLSVIKDFGTGTPFTGSTPMISGEIAEDFTHYLAVSEQQPSAVALGVLVGGDGLVRSGGGYIVSLLPGANEDVLAELLERNIERLGGVSFVLNDNPDPWKVVELVMDGFEPQLLQRTPAAYRCGCSRDRVAAAIASLGADDLEDIESKNEAIEVTCGFCDNIYIFSEKEIKEIAKK